MSDEIIKAKDEHIETLKEQLKIKDKQIEALFKTINDLTTKINKGMF